LKPNVGPINISGYKSNHKRKDSYQSCSQEISVSQSQHNYNYQKAVKQINVNINGGSNSNFGNYASSNSAGASAEVNSQVNATRINSFKSPSNNRYQRENMD